MAKRRRPSGAGAVRLLPSGRWQAKHRDDDGALRPAPHTFDTRLDADAWLQAHRQGHVSVTPGRLPKSPTFSEYSTHWLANRELKPRTSAEYRRLLDSHLTPTFGRTRLDAITVADVESWYAGMGSGAPTSRARAYGLLRAIFRSAERSDIISKSPCRIVKGDKAKKSHSTQVPTMAEVDALADAMPGQYRVMVFLAAYCGVRFGELTELRRKDVNLERGTIRVSRAVTRVGSEYIVSKPKSDAGVRTVAMPRFVTEQLGAHLDSIDRTAPDALLFVGERGAWLAPSTLYGVYWPARESVGLDSLRWHDLRHCAGTWASQAGASLREVQARLGHSTVAAAMVYQHATPERDADIANALETMRGNGGRR